jgi:hypothetical protein
MSSAIVACTNWPAQVEQLCSEFKSHCFYFEAIIFPTYISRINAAIAAVTTVAAVAVVCHQLCCLQSWQPCQLSATIITVCCSYYCCRHYYFLLLCAAATAFQCSSCHYHCQSLLSLFAVVTAILVTIIIIWCHNIYCLLSFGLLAIIIFCALITFTEAITLQYHAMAIISEHVNNF